MFLGALAGEYCLFAADAPLVIGRKVKGVDFGTGDHSCRTDCEGGWALTSEAARKSSRLNGSPCVLSLSELRSLKLSFPDVPGRDGGRWIWRSAAGIPNPPYPLEDCSGGA